MVAHGQAVESLVVHVLGGCVGLVAGRLNDRDENLPIRRKVGGLERGNVFELGFGAKGRIYYGHAEGGRMRIILVGAKNTQDKDLAYLRRYREPPSPSRAS